MFFVLDPEESFFHLINYVSGSVLCEQVTVEHHIIYNLNLKTSNILNGVTVNHSSNYFLVLFSHLFLNKTKLSAKEKCVELLK